jgi:hypothetical protein
VVGRTIQEKGKAIKIGKGYGKEEGGWGREVMIRMKLFYRED